MDCRRDLWRFPTPRIYFIVSVLSLIVKLSLKEPPDPGHVFLQVLKVHMRDQVGGAMLES